MFVTHKFQHCTVLKIPNFEQNAAKFPIQAPRAMFPKESEKALSMCHTLLPSVCPYDLNCCPPLSQKRGDIKSHSSVCLSVCLSLCLSVTKNFNLGNSFCTITGRALILGMCVLCDKTFLMVPCRDLDRDLWPTSRSNLLPSGGPQLSEFACSKCSAPLRTCILEFSHSLK